MREKYFDCDYSAILSRPFSLSANPFHDGYLIAKTGANEFLDCFENCESIELSGC